MPDCSACEPGCTVVAFARDGTARCARCYLHAEDPEVYPACPNLTTPGDPVSDERLARAKAEALRSMRDFFRSTDMPAAADHCEQSAIGWDSAADDAARLAARTPAPAPDGDALPGAVDLTDADRAHGQVVDGVLLFHEVAVGRIVADHLAARPAPDLAERDDLRERVQALAEDLAASEGERDDLDTAVGMLLGQNVELKDSATKHYAAFVGAEAERARLAIALDDVRSALLRGGQTGEIRARDALVALTGHASTAAPTAGA